MKPRFLITPLLVLTVWCALYGYQRGTGQRRAQAYEREMQSPADEDPPDAWEEKEFAFARLRYRSYGRGFRRGSWGTDANTAERHLIRGIRRLTRIDARSVEEIIDVESDEMYKWPWLYAVEVGSWQLSEAHTKRLREYLDRGGFLMVDDFHGESEWDAFLASLRRVFPDRQVEDIADTEQILHTMYDLDKRAQIPGHQYVWSGLTYERYDGRSAHWRGVFDDRRRVQVAICHNVDLGDAWEWADDPRYPEAFTSMAYRIGLNYIIYSMTH